MAADRVIALYSPAPQSGKSTFAKYYAEACAAKGLWVERFSFADPLRAMIGGLLKTLGYGPQKIRSCFFGKLKEVPIVELGGKTPRYLLQTIGTEWGRELITPQVWVNVMAERLWKTAADVVLIDDLRFENELTFIGYQVGGIPVKIIRPDMKRTTSHSSEGGLDQFYFSRVVLNNGTKEDLRKAAYQLCERL